MTATEVDRTPVQGELETDGDDMYPDESRSLENLRHMRLMALLRDMIDTEGGEKAAQALGVSYRTVSRTIESDRLTGRMSAVLERHLLLGGGSAAAQQRKSIKALEKRVGELEEGLGSGLEELRGVFEKGIEGLREEYAQGLRQLERRLVKVEVGRGDRDSTDEIRDAVEKTAVKPAWRPYRDLVTLEPEPGEEQVYGDATPLIVEWRKVRTELLDAKDGLSRAIAEERMRELEIELIGERELTLPPRTYPWDGSDRRDEVWRRTQGLERARVERSRAQIRRWIRRVLTLGLWRD